MTPAQLTTMKATILAQSALTSAVAAGNHGAIINFYNTLTSGPAVMVWKPAIQCAELNTAVVWSEYVALTVAKQNCYMALTQGGVVDATNSNVRAGFSTIFAGTSITNLTALAQRVATRFEAVFIVAGVCPLNLFGASMSVEDAVLALNS